MMDDKVRNKALRARYHARKELTAAVFSVADFAPLAAWSFVVPVTVCTPQCPWQVRSYATYQESVSSFLLFPRLFRWQMPGLCQLTC